MLPPGPTWTVIVAADTAARAARRASAETAAVKKVGFIEKLPSLAAHSRTSEAEFQNFYRHPATLEK
jgi:hypothetical protein